MRLVGLTPAGPRRLHCNRRRYRASVAAARAQRGARLRAAAAFDAWERLFADVLERMRGRGELRADASPAVLATALLASIEGGWC